MKRSHGLHGALLVVLVVLATTVIPSARAQQRTVNPHDLTAQVKAFDSYSKDFREMEKSVHGEELQVLEFLNGVAITAEDRLHAADVMLRMYDGISCAPDRIKVKPIVKQELEYYSWQMDNEAGRTSGSLAFSKVPAAAQLGLRMNDDLRAAKNKLDAIAAGL